VKRAVDQAVVLVFAENDALIAERSRTGQVTVRMKDGDAVFRHASSARHHVVRDFATAQLLFEQVVPIEGHDGADPLLTCAERDEVDGGCETRASGGPLATTPIEMIANRVNERIRRRRDGPAPTRRDGLLGEPREDERILIEVIAEPDQECPARFGIEPTPAPRRRRMAVEQVEYQFAPAGEPARYRHAGAEDEHQPAREPSFAKLPHVTGVDGAATQLELLL